MAFSPDGRFLVAGSAALSFWDVATRQPLGTPLYRHTSWVTSVAFSPDGKTVASSSNDGTVRLWDAATRQPLGESLGTASDRITSVAFSPDGRTLASGSEVGTFQLWDVATHQALGQRFQGNPGGVNSLAFSPDSKLLTTGGNDGLVLLWDVSLESWESRACAMAGRNLTRAEWAEYLPGQAYHKTCAQWPDGQ